MTCAVYKLREDGDYDFVAAFAKDQLQDMPSDWPKEIADLLNREGEDALIIEGLDLNKLPDVWTTQMQTSERTSNGGI